MRMMLVDPSGENGSMAVVVSVGALTMLAMKTDDSPQGGSPPWFATPT